MGRNTSPNITYYHYRAEINHNNGTEKIVKYYYTLDDICKEFGCSTFTIYRIMKNPEYSPKMKMLQGVKFYKDYQPAFRIVKNENIFGELDECDF
jgi:AraC-like DNA-binding protein